MLPSVVPRLATDLAVRVFPGVWKLLSFLRLPSQDGSVPTSFVSLFIFYIFSYLLSKTMGCFSWCLMSSDGIQKLFCEIYSEFKCSFDEYVGEKMVSPSYSSAIFNNSPASFLIGVRRALPARSQREKGDRRAFTCLSTQPNQNTTWSKTVSPLTFKVHFALVGLIRCR